MNTYLVSCELFEVLKVYVISFIFSNQLFLSEFVLDIYQFLNYFIDTFFVFGIYVY